MLLRFFRFAVMLEIGAFATMILTAKKKATTDACGGKSGNKQEGQ
jgi:hypothetical protein